MDDGAEARGNLAPSMAPVPPQSPVPHTSNKTITRSEGGTLSYNNKAVLERPEGALPLSSNSLPNLFDLSSLFSRSPSLDCFVQNCTRDEIDQPPTITWTKQQRRAYHRILSGLRVHKSELLRFLTLTTAENMQRDLRTSWRVLKERIRRLTPLRLIKMGYVKPNDVRKYYPNKPLNQPLKFEYIKVETDEGVEGVLHVLYFGDYIPQKWLSDAWKEITGSAYIVDIRACKDPVKSPKRLARYCVAQYVSGQSAFIRYSWSWGWVGKGFVKVWKILLKELNYDIKKAIALWEKLLSGESLILGSKLFKPPPEIEVVELKQGDLNVGG